MTDNPPELPPAKKPYSPPTLIVHGTLEEITRGGTINGPPTGGGNGPTGGGTGPTGGIAGSHIPAASR